MDSEIVALVKSPAKGNNYHLRKGNGFSLKEIKEAGLSVQALKDLSIKIDYYRRSANQLNVDTLKTLEVPKKKGKKRKPFVKKEKKRTPFKPKEVKKKEKQVKVKEKVLEKPATKKPKTKEKAPTKKKTKAEEAPVAKIKEIEKALEESKAAAETEGTPLIKLSGLGITTAKKFESLGVTSIEELIKEDPAELVKLIKGASEVKISTWIKEGEKILKESK